MEEGIWFAALGEFQGYRESAGARPEGLLGEARCHRLLHRPADSLAAYSEAFALLVDQGRFSEAAEAAEEMVRVSGNPPPDPDRHLSVARYLEDHDEIIRAADCYEMAGRLDAYKAKKQEAGE